MTTAPTSRRLMRITWKRVLLALLVAIVACATAFAFRFVVPFLPGRTHERITISLPFAEEDDARELIPMGETVNHPDSPHGHPGIDFSWDHDVPIIYDTFWVDRLCPMTYFDEDSRRRIERIWDRSTGRFKDRFPDICSGFYYGRNE